MTIAVVDGGPRRISRAADVNAPVADIFEIVASPARHNELDGSGTVVLSVSGPERLTQGARFTMKMRQHGFPYRITSVVTEFDDGHVIEWQHPLGHRWRWELKPSADNSTLVTETFDYSRLGPVKARSLELYGAPKQNAAGIEATLRKLQDRYAAG